MSLLAYGYAGSMQVPEDARLVAEGNRLEYRRGALVEWYVNDGNGLEQGFSLEERPLEGGVGDLVIELGLEGSLEPYWLEEEQAIQFEDAEGHSILRYSGLLAWDATGEMLPVQMVQLDKKWNLRVDDREAVYPITIDPVITNESAKLLPDDGAVGDQFGHSVALSGDTAVVGARRDDDNGIISGSAYVFVRSGTSWAQEAKLSPVDGAAGDQFGRSVAISGDTAVVGAHGDDDNGSDSGSAYVFVRSGTSWAQEAKLSPVDGAAGDRFGRSVALSGDTAVVGAFRDGDNGNSSGSAYVFVRSGTSWAQEAKLLPDDGAAGDRFGISVALSGDTAVVGAPEDDDNGSNSGSAYVFVRSGTSWAQEAKLLPVDGAAGDRFGRSVALSGDTAVVGAHLNDDKGSRSGSAYVFVLVTAVSIDIKPGNDPNSINLKSNGVIPVAILSDDDFNAVSEIRPKM